MPTGKKDTLAYNLRLNQGFLWSDTPIQTSQEAGFGHSQGQQRFAA